MKFHSVVIFVKNIERSKDFYIRILAQKIKQDFGKNVILEGGLSIWEISERHNIHKKLRIKGKSHRFEIYFEHKDIEVIFHKLKMEGVKFLHDIYEESWGQKTFRFFDPDGHLVEIGEPIQTFVRNLQDRGLSLDQIVEKTGISQEDVQNMLKENDG